MKFILSIYPDRTVELSPEQRAAIPDAVSAWIEEMDGRGVRLEGHVLEPASEAATVRVRDGNVVRENGPATDSDVQVSGFNLLDCADLNEALEVAAKHPVAAFGVLELRAFADA
ncbi:MAG TPA: YciI family protein [Candidatus Eisenbacteria bacterium]|nr:YciI family protein [Candidatus Eisenbacteria bacterium]